MEKHGILIGDYVKVDKAATAEEIAKAKENVIDSLCNLIHKIAKESDDLFIIKDAEDGKTIATKLELTTVKSI